MKIDESSRLSMTSWKLCDSVSAYSHTSASSPISSSDAAHAKPVIPSEAVPSDEAGEQVVAADDADGAEAEEGLAGRERVRGRSHDAAHQSKAVGEEGLVIDQRSLFSGAQGPSRDVADDDAEESRHLETVSKLIPDDGREGKHQGLEEPLGYLVSIIERERA
jgi:hypothetical protein